MPPNAELRPLDVALLRRRAPIALPLAVLCGAVITLAAYWSAPAALAAEPQWKAPSQRVTPSRAVAAKGNSTSNAVAAHLAQAAEKSGDDETAAEDLPTPTPAAPQGSKSHGNNVQPQWMPDRGGSPPPADYGNMAGQFQPAPTYDAGEYDGGEYGEGYYDDSQYGDGEYGDSGESGEFGLGRGIGFRPIRNAWSRFNAQHNVPLEGESWRYRPYSLSGFVGGAFGDDLQDHHLEQQAAASLGGRIGWDMGRYVGGELRGWYSNPATKFRPATTDQLEAHLFGFDVDVLYYPWGETRLRPYLMAGLGFVDVTYHTQPTSKADDMMLSIPFGLGLKYRLDNRFVLRGEFIDNYSFQGSVTDEMHNLAVTMGIEVRFGGGDRRSYYPWNPQLSTW